MKDTFNICQHFYQNSLIHPCHQICILTVRKQTMMIARKIMIVKELAAPPRTHPPLYDDLTTGGGGNFEQLVNYTWIL